MSQKVCRWGIAGTSGIARKNWQSIRNAGNARLVAVASRDIDRAEQFVADCQSEVPYPETPESVAGYEHLINRGDVDAVYLPLPTAIRTEWAIRAAKAGKHIMVEKPCGIDADEVRQILNACRENNVLFMDGVMLLHSARLPQIRASLDGGAIGDLKRITTAFSFGASDDFLRENIRVKSHLEPLGCLGDLGWYTIGIILWAMNYRRPRHVTGRILSQIQVDDSPLPTPTEFSGELFFDGGVSASYYCAFVAEHQQWLRVSGTKGYLTVEDFVLPRYGSELEFYVSNHAFEITGCQFNMEQRTTRHVTREYSNNAPSAQETRLFREFSRLVVTGEVNGHWGDVSLLTQQVLDACLESARQESCALPVT